jgi:hypothetical protein
MNGVVWTDAVTYAMSSPIMDGLKCQSAEDILNGMKQAWEDARMMMMVRREKMKINADRDRRDEKYEVGDRVLLSTKNLSKHSSKLSDPFIGPFPITRVSDHGVNVWLSLPKEYSRVHQPFHIEKVKRYTPSTTEWGRKQNDRPLPEVIDGEEEWEVEMLLGKRQGEELVEVQTDEGGADDTHPPSTLDEVKEEVGPIRRSARLASKAVVGGEGGGPTSKRKRRRVRQWVTRYLVKWKGFGGEEATRPTSDSMHRRPLMNTNIDRRRREGKRWWECITCTQ